MLTRCHADIVESEVSDTRVELQQQGQRLANATSGTKDGHLGQLKAEKGGTVSTGNALVGDVGTSGGFRLGAGLGGKGSYLAGRGREGTALDTGGSEHIGCAGEETGGTGLADVEG